MRYDQIEEVNKNIDDIEHVKKVNPYHDPSTGRFTSKGGGGASAGGTAGGALTNLKGIPNKDVPGKKVQTVNGGGTVTMGKPAHYDGFASERIKRGKEYAIKDISRGTVKVGTYNGTKSSSVGGSYSFTGRDGKKFSVEFDNTHMNPIYEVK